MGFQGIELGNIKWDLLRSFDGDRMGYQWDIFFDYDMGILWQKDLYTSCHVIVKHL
jgi:hypothetical protein